MLCENCRCEEAVITINGSLIDGPEFLCEPCYEEKKLNSCDVCGARYEKLRLFDDKAFCEACCQELLLQAITGFRKSINDLMKMADAVQIIANPKEINVLVTENSTVFSNRTACVEKKKDHGLFSCKKYVVVDGVEFRTWTENAGE